MIMTFNELKITDPILKAIGEKGYLAPTPIQQKGIPVALDGRDMLGIAQTGTGKTAAFAIPILQHLSSGMQAEPTDVPRRNRRGRNHGREYGVRPIRALILTPTRELALQIGESFEAYGKYLKLRSTVIFGGVGQAPQVEALKKGVDILIACPGRLNDLIGQGFIDLSDLEIFVLDEATSSVDTETEQLIQHAIQKVLAGRTSFIIAHRLSTIRSADRILVIQNGKITEDGTHQQLIAKQGYYYQLYTNQFQEEQGLEILDGAMAKA